MHFHRSQYDTSIVQLWILLHAEKRGLQRSVLDQPARFIDKRWHQPKHSLCCCLTLTDSVKLCVMGIFAELYLVIPLSLTETLFQGHYSVKRQNLKMPCQFNSNSKVLTSLVQTLYDCIHEQGCAHDAVYCILSLLMDNIYAGQIISVSPAFSFSVDGKHKT